MRLRADNCLTATGQSVDPYYVLEYPQWVTVFPITTSGEVVLVRQYRHATKRVLLELPGGAVEKQDTDVIAAAIRELAEETGYTGKSFTEIAQYAPNPGNQTNLSHVVLGTGLEQTMCQSLDSSEEIEVVLMPLEQVVPELQKGSFVHATHVAALYRGLHQLGALK